MKGIFKCITLYLAVLLQVYTYKGIKLGDVVGLFGMVLLYVAAKLINVPCGSEASVKKKIEMCR